MWDTKLTPPYIICRCPAPKCKLHQLSDLVSNPPIYKQHDPPSIQLPTLLSSVLSSDYPNQQSNHRPTSNNSITTTNPRTISNNLFRDPLSHKDAYPSSHARKGDPTCGDSLLHFHFHLRSRNASHPISKPPIPPTLLPFPNQ